jgi:hypothetical protein
MLDNTGSQSVDIGLHTCKTCSDLSISLTKPLFYTNLARYGRNWSSTSFSTSVRPPHDTIPRRCPAGRVQAFHVLAGPALCPVHCSYSHYCKYPLLYTLVLFRKAN